MEVNGDHDLDGKQKKVQHLNTAAVMTFPPADKWGTLRVFLSTYSPGIWDGPRTTSTNAPDWI